ncbi:unnamed protein product [Musa acuminata var. zebrina]
MQAARKVRPMGFLSYQLCPGSPMGRLISPSSTYSGTSSPFPDPEFHSRAGGSFQSFPIREPPKILSAEEIAAQKIIPPAASLVDSAIVPRNNEHTVDQRVSFELARWLATSGEGSSDASTARNDGALHSSVADNGRRIGVDDVYAAIVPLS